MRSRNRGEECVEVLSSHEYVPLEVVDDWDPVRQTMLATADADVMETSSTEDPEQLCNGLDAFVARARPAIRPDTVCLVCGEAPSQNPLL